jgi:hypothetical protein
MTNGAIRPENPSKQFKKVEALRNLNLTVPDGVCLRPRRSQRRRQNRARSLRQSLWISSKPVSG